MWSRGGRVRALVIALALSGCDNSGMEIIVHGPTASGAEQPFTVELFIGLGDAMPNAIAPAPGIEPRFDAQRWDRDPTNVADTTAYGAGPARFLFRPGDGTETFGAVVAVGYDQAGTPMSSGVLFGPQLGHSRVLAYTINLSPFTDPIASPTGNNGLLLWGPSSRTQPDHSCVFVHNTPPDPMRASAMIVTAGDRDCDGLADQPNPLECDSNIWFAKRTATRSNTQCLTFAAPSPAPGLPVQCMLGGPTCTDGVGDDTTCTANRYCAHPALCEAALCGTGTAAWDCAKDVRTAPNRATSTAYPTIACTVYVDTGTVVNGRVKVCQDEGTFALSTIGLPATATCARAEVRSRTQGFQPELADGNAAYQIKVDTACTLTVNGDGDYLATGALAESVSGLLAVDLQSSMHGMAIPIQFDLQPTTASGQCAPPHCSLIGPLTTQLASCLAQPPPL